ncbi:hypothetical protein TD95_003258 [Thielaviopsis punctulata]|uniref:PXA domain-containing protein n=1 Tax=Thielaviopsis punctulata TaxID=72032 RepID=A0A0F4ZAL2_9PEZI|nr:hypothetical protein TD95_003258 [Thielaviopsis punctulata]
MDALSQSRPATAKELQPELSPPLDSRDQQHDDKLKQRTDPQETEACSLSKTISNAETEAEGDALVESRPLLAQTMDAGFVESVEPNQKDPIGSDLGQSDSNGLDAKAPATNHATNSKDLSVNAQDIATKALDFLSTASSSTLSGAAAGLALVVYIVLGRIGLLLIGAVAGVVAFLAYDGRTPQQLRQMRAEVGAEVLQRLLSTSTLSATDTKSSSMPALTDPEKDRIVSALDDFPPLTRAALNDLIEAAIRDFVSSWYGSIVPRDESFSLSCREAITNYIINISNHLSYKRPADVFLNLTTNSVSMLIVFFSELATAFAQFPPDSDNTAAYIVYNYLAEHPDSNLANLLNQRQQTAKLKTIAEDLLTWLDQPLLACAQTRIFLREIFSGVILEKTLLSCSQPEWINGWIVSMLEAGEPDFSQAIDVGMQSKPDTKKLASLVEASGGARPAGDSVSAGDSGVSASAVGPETLDAEARALQEMQRMNQMIVEEEVKCSDSPSLGPRTPPRSRSAMSDLQGTPSRPQDTFAQAQCTPPPHTATPTKDGSRTPATPASRMSTQQTLDTQEPLDLLSKTPEPLLGKASEPSSSSAATNTPESADNELRPFTSFDQMMPPVKDLGVDEIAKKAPLTLHNCTITVHDDDTDSTWKLLGKPNWEYLVQVEPASSHYPGWMVVRKYSDFESLHEILRRIASISGSDSFAKQHWVFPSWRGHTRSSLRTELELYLRDACWYQPLAESEGMKRFLDKDQGMPKVPEKSLFRWNAVGDMLDAVADAPKGALQGGKAVVGGLFGSIGNLGKRSSQAVPGVSGGGGASATADPFGSPRVNPRDSPNSPQSTPSLVSIKDPQQGVSSQPSTVGDDSDSTRKSQYERWERISQDEGSNSLAQDDGSNKSGGSHSRGSSMGAMISPRSPSACSIEYLNLPPPPDQMTDNIETSVLAARERGNSILSSRERGSSVLSTRERGNSVLSQSSTGRAGPSVGLSRHGTFGSAKVHVKSESVATTAVVEVEEAEETEQKVEKETESEHERDAEKEKEKEVKHPPLTEPETRVAVELLFAVINELYTLSSAWNFRRTLLTAAKSFLLRPGNPSLVAIQEMIQSSVLDDNTSDAGLASYISKIRQSAMPTAEEMAAWPGEMTAEDKEKLRVKARRLLIESGVPGALKGVMGQNATSEAMGRLFDCLQMEEVARGLVFGLLLQTVRMITH